MKEFTTRVEMNVSDSKGWRSDRKVGGRVDIYERNREKRSCQPRRKYRQGREGRTLASERRGAEEGWKTVDVGVGAEVDDSIIITGVDMHVSDEQERSTWASGHIVPDCQCGLVREAEAGLPKGARHQRAGAPRQ